MFFAKNEIIELSGGKKHLVTEVLEYEGKYYYYVTEIDSSEKEIIPPFKVITTISENGSLFVKTIKGNLEEKIKEKFEEILSIN